MFEPYNGRAGRVPLRFGRKADVFQKDVIQNELFEASAALKVVFERPVIQERVEILKILAAHSRDFSHELAAFFV
ncbi:MAG: hypothetical protein J6023_07225 [Clostridia bacterium]|nr:hypothetical protein [Clostridia bacterium]